LEGMPQVVGAAADDPGRVKGGVPLAGPPVVKRDRAALRAGEDERRLSCRGRRSRAARARKVRGTRRRERAVFG
jgi:hypothetical protein